MKKLLNSAWTLIKSINFKILTPYLIIIVLVIGGYYFYKKTQKLNEERTSALNLVTSLNAELKSYKNSYNEVVKEKLTIQSDLKTLEKLNGKLTSEKNNLITRLESETKEKNIIAAALIETKLKLDSLLKSIAHIDNVNKTITFNSLPTNKDLTYQLRVDNVEPYQNNIPTLTFEKFELNNTQFIEFHWKSEPKNGYPVSFSVSNSNKYFQTYDIESYTIPEIKKSELKPTFWQKLGKTLKSSSGDLIIFGAGLGTGLLIK